MTVKEDLVKAKRPQALRREQLTAEWLQLGGRADDNEGALLQSVDTATRQVGDKVSGRDPIWGHS